MNQHHDSTNQHHDSANQHYDSTEATDEQRITLRGPAELADALPYILGFHPTDSVVLVALHGSRGRFGGRVRLGIPESPREWSPVAEQLAECLIGESGRRGSRPDGIVVFLCQDPARDASARQVMERLRPFAQRLRTACGALDVPVYEAICISGGRFWSYCCPDSRCCPADGRPLELPGTTVMAAAAAYAGIQVRGTLRDMEARLAPRQGAEAQDQQRALDDVAAQLLPRTLLVDGGWERTRSETLELCRAVMRRLERSRGGDGTTDAVDFTDAGKPPGASGTPGGGAGTGAGGDVARDAEDDWLITDDEAARMICGLQDRVTRDKAARWMEGTEAAPALRLWRALSRRCVGPYLEYAAAPLSLAGWVAWSSGDEPEARIALGLALRADPEYHFAQLLHQACNQGLDPEQLRNCLRDETDGALPDAERPRRRLRTRVRRSVGERTSGERTSGERTSGERASGGEPARIGGASEGVAGGVTESVTEDVTEGAVGGATGGTARAEGPVRTRAPRAKGVGTREPNTRGPGSREAGKRRPATSPDASDAAPRRRTRTDRQTGRPGGGAGK
ncbi:DUF4192 domain-containing protein [Streptomyces sp. NPDC050504]|uniref:DUF4192 domain-containing protein n=1 Tax=Streptomyces sp. NPDC050504 TaxID=3365618 RepID=UPI003799D5D4